jgi:hypothetical protein
MGLAGTIGNCDPNISSARIPVCIFSAWGVTRKFFGLLVVCNQVLLVLVGLIGLIGEAFTDKGLMRRCVPQRAPPGLSATFSGVKHFNSRLAALEPHTERFLKTSLEWYSAGRVVLVAAGAVLCLWSTIWTTTRSGARIEPAIDVGLGTEAYDRDRW